MTKQFDMSHNVLETDRYSVMSISSTDAARGFQEAGSLFVYMENNKWNKDYRSFKGALDNISTFPLAEFHLSHLN